MTAVDRVQRQFALRRRRWREFWCARLHSTAVASRQFGKAGVEGLSVGICMGAWGGAGRSGGPTWLGAGARTLAPELRWQPPQRQGSTL